MLIYFKPDVIYYVALSEEVQMVSPQKTHQCCLLQRERESLGIYGIVLFMGED
jgi:hypothetical protein